jgi:hypothetical protein
MVVGNTGVVVRQLSMGASANESSWEVSTSAAPFMAGLEERESSSVVRFGHRQPRQADVVLSSVPLLVMGFPRPRSVATILRYISRLDYN